jgi:hypothetical protein
VKSDGGTLKCPRCPVTTPLPRYLFVMVLEFILFLLVFMLFSFV